MIPIAKPYIGTAEKAAVNEVLESGMLAQGKRTAALEGRFADLCGVRHAIATSSGTTALHVALLAHGIGSGDEVITTPFTFIATANSILFTGARPVFVDIQADTFNIDPERVKAAVTERTRAIMPVHLFGQPCDMDELLAIAADHNLAIIEDAAQAVGASYKESMTGGFGTGVFSLYATKNVMSGEGGMITTDDDEVAARSRLLRNHGMKRRYHYEMLGYNYRLSDLHAAIGLAQMDRLNAFTRRRRSNAAFLSRHLKCVITPAEKADRDHVWHQYTVRVPAGMDRDEAVRRLNQNGVGTAVFYPIPSHQHPYMRQYTSEQSLPGAEKAAREVFSIPVHPQLSQQDLETIVAEVNKL